MGIAHKNELCLPKLGYHVDIAILSITDTAEVVTPLADKVAARAREAVRAATVTYRGLVIEVDGPSHYDVARRLLPATALIRRHLGARVLRCCRGVVLGVGRAQRPRPKGSLPRRAALLAPAACVEQGLARDDNIAAGF
ncbi:hypothetical protein T492DRAFT_836976 [Pavlovales sp. CCMP2436]|nr:hypothetical protein T492DRAFT_836976 [Pavlovales sp. CCMP2436]